MHIIGIVGGIASGKSFVTNCLREMGAGVLDADRAGHEVLCTAEVERAVRQRWGDGVFGPDGRVDRQRLAEIVFTPSKEGVEARKYLEQLTHPAIGERLREQAEQLQREGCAVIVLDAALLLEAGWDKLCDRLVFVDTPHDQRLARARWRGWSEEEFSAREATQESLEFKRRRADCVIDNSGSPEAVRAQVERFWHSLVG
jgi:dephospho-CoA kinase